MTVRARRTQHCSKTEAAIGELARKRQLKPEFIRELARNTKVDRTRALLERIAENLEGYRHV